MYTVLMPIGTDGIAVANAIGYLERLPLAEELAVIVLHARKDIDVVGSDGGRVTIEHDEFDVPASVTDAVEALEALGVDTTLDLRAGDVAESVESAMADHQIDQIVVPARKRSPVGKVIFGSATLDIVRATDLPVTIVTEGSDG